MKRISISSIHLDDSKRRKIKKKYALNWKLTPQKQKKNVKKVNEN